MTGVALRDWGDHKCINLAWSMWQLSALIAKGFPLLFSSFNHLTQVLWAIWKCSQLTFLLSVYGFRMFSNFEVLSRTVAL